MQSAVDPELAEQIKSLLRRDLKLGLDTPLHDDTPLVGGDFDIDSLDILLLVSGIEKQFGIKIPSEAVGKWVFKDVGTLARYVADNHETLRTKPDAASVAPPPVDHLAKLPHGEAFRFVSRVDAVMPGKSARGVWTPGGTEPFFAAHFPGRPIVPGVLLIEALAQLAGLCSSHEIRAGKLAHADVRFESAVAPPATIELTATVTHELGQLLQCDVTATNNGVVAARGTVTIAVDIAV